MSVAFRKIRECSLETEQSFGKLRSCIRRLWCLKGGSDMAETSSNGWIVYRNWDIQPLHSIRVFSASPLLPTARDLGVGNGLGEDTAGRADLAASKHWCGINTALVTSPKHSTIQAAVKKVNSIPARPNTLLDTNNVKLTFSLKCHLPTHFFLI